jgi:hypothetical protein
MEQLAIPNDSLRPDWKNNLQAIWFESPAVEALVQEVADLQYQVIFFEGGCTCAKATPPNNRTLQLGQILCKSLTALRSQSICRRTRLTFFRDMPKKDHEQQSTTKTALSGH